MEARPKIKLVLTPFDRLLETGGIILLIIMWTLAIFNYFQSPETVAIHFDSFGKPDGYGNKLTNLILPVIPTLLYLGLSQLNKYPHIFNYLQSVTNENAKFQYAGATRIIRILKVSIVLFFTIDILFALLTTLGFSKGLGMWSLPLIIVLVGGPVIYGIAGSLKKKPYDK